MASGNKERKPNPEKTNYAPSEQDRFALNQFIDKRKKRLPARIKVKNNGLDPSISVDHPHETFGLAQLMQALGTADEDFMNGILHQLSNVGSQGQKVDEAGVNFILSIIKGIEPKDQIETMLAIQMAAVHIATMTFARRLAHVENIPQQDSAERAFNKLTRTFTIQIEALKRYRTGGEQKVTVQHVSVNEGGQAIVGNVSQAPHKDGSNEIAASPLAIADAKTAPMPNLSDSRKSAAVPARRRRDK